MIREPTEHAREVVVLDSAFLDPNWSSKEDAIAADLDLDPVLVILNHNLPRLTAALWGRARLIVVADGGADRLLEASRRWEEEEEEEKEGDGRGSAGTRRRWRRRRRRSDDAADAADADDESGKEGEGEKTPRPRFLPDAIVGDLDSISDGARSYYESLGVRVVDLSRDQDSTDLQKCLEFAAAEVGKEEQQKYFASSSSSSSSSPSSSSPPPIFVAGALGGRLDHSLSALSTLYAIDAARARLRNKREGESEEKVKQGNSFADAVARSLGQVVLAGDGSLARLIPSSSSSSSSFSSKESNFVVKILPCLRVEGPGCGLVALGSPAKGVETSGLKWDLGGGGVGNEVESSVLEMGGLQSTSNSIEAAEVTVSSRAAKGERGGGGGSLLWTTTLRGEWS